MAHRPSSGLGCVLSLLALTVCCGALGHAAELENVEQWGVFELRRQGDASENPYLDLKFSAVFEHGSRQVTVPGFYDGNGIYVIRFSPDRLGMWSLVTQSNRPTLNGHSASFRCVKPTGENHGPLRIVNTYYLEYADGTPFYSVGTTAYQWTSVKKRVQEQTVNTLARSPFNKIRMCVFPISYNYGNDSEPWQYPFAAQNRFTQPNYAFFQNFDKRVRQLLDLGIQADVILFHPYDKWGYAAMGKANNARYVRYMIARLSAYRNVWWSLANEWDIPSIKESIDWEGIGTILQIEDPHHRFRGIHNWYDSEDHFYDHSRPWITHTCTQTSQFYHAVKWRRQYQQPLLFDEMRYEGDVQSNWGNMSSEEMASYFWMAGLSGGYGTHGDTHRNASDDTTEVRWWAKGGLLVGQSPQRIAFFKSFMETLPIKDMTPSLDPQGKPKNLNNNVYTFAKEGEVYVSYAAAAHTEIHLQLPGERPYQFCVIDTWNMTRTSKADVRPGDFRYTTQNRYEAVFLSVGESAGLIEGSTKDRMGEFQVPALWEYSAPLIAPEQRQRDPSRAQKDPTVVFYGGKWHVFMTVKLPGRSAIEHCSFEKWADAHASPRTILKVSDSDYYCAPQVFYFVLHQRWYLIYQMGVPGANKMWVAYSTTTDIADPQSWTRARPALDGGDDDPRQVGGLDYWIICDDQRAYLFLTSLNGKMWRLWTKLEDFPQGFAHCELALEAKIFEASHTYRLKGMDKYLTVIEENGRRYYKAYLADHLDGPWTPIADTVEHPFAGWKNVRPALGVAPWTDNISHGELIRDGYDQTLTVDPAHLRFIFQGMWDKDKSGRGYGQFQWRIGMLTPVDM